MSMNAQDFSRNFQVSHFGISGKFFKEEILEKGRLDLPLKNAVIEDDWWIPCTNPQVRSASTFTAKCLVKVGNTYNWRMFAAVPWSPLFDETSFVNIDTPSSRMCEDAHGVLWLSVIPVRGTARGYNPRSTRSTALEARARTEAGLPSNGGAGDNIVIWNMLNEKYTSIQEAYAKLLDGEVLGCALSKYLACHLDIGEEHIALNFKGNKVGSLLDATNILLNENVSDVAIRYITKLYPYAYVKIQGGRSLW